MEFYDWSIRPAVMGTAHIECRGKLDTAQLHLPGVLHLKLNLSKLLCFISSCSSISVPSGTVCGPLLVTLAMVMSLVEFLTLEAGIQAKRSDMKNHMWDWPCDNVVFANNYHVSSAAWHCLEPAVWYRHRRSDPNRIVDGHGIVCFVSLSVRQYVIDVGDTGRTAISLHQVYEPRVLDFRYISNYRTDVSSRRIP